MYALYLTREFLPPYGGKEVMHNERIMLYYYEPKQ